MKFFVYSRKSVATGKGESVENQVEMCRQYIRSKFPDDTGTEVAIYEDEGFSAKNTDRPQFQQMLRDIRRLKPDFVVCYRLDRISRNVSDFSALIEDLNRRGISFICIKEEFDTSKPMGKAMMYIASVFAQLERETIAERVRDNMLMLARTGRWLGGATPTGYTSEKVEEFVLDGKIKTSCQLKGDPEELSVVNLIFETFLELHSISGVSKCLIRREIKSRGGKYYSLPGIKEILQNPVYCVADRDAYRYFTAKHSDVCFAEKDCSKEYGLLAYNKRDYKKGRAPRQPMAQWIIAMGKHKGIVPGKKWAAVQKILADNIPTGKKPAKIHNGYSLLSGLIYCGECGGRMFAKHRSGKNASQEAFDYICSNKLRGGTRLCRCQNISGSQADGAVCLALADHMTESPGFGKGLEKLKRGLQAAARESPVKELESSIQKCAAETERLIRTLSQGDFSAAFLQQVSLRIESLQDEQARLTAQKEAAEKNAGENPDREAKISAMAEGLSSLKSCFSTLTVPEKQSFIRSCIEKIVWDEGGLHVFLSGR